MEKVVFCVLSCRCCAQIIGNYCWIYPWSIWYMAKSVAEHSRFHRHQKCWKPIFTAWCHYGMPMESVYSFCVFEYLNFFYWWTYGLSWVAHGCLFVGEDLEASESLARNCPNSVKLCSDITRTSISYIRLKKSNDFGLSIDYCEKQ